MSDSDHAVTSRIESLHVKGFRSLADLQLDDIPNPMVLLGANGAGKSNVLRFFQFLDALFRRSLGEFVQQRGGANDQLFGGHHRTKRIEAKVSFGTYLGSNTYEISLERTDADELKFANEEFRHRPIDGKGGLNYGPYSSGRESGFALIAGSERADNRSKAAVNLLQDSMVLPVSRHIRHITPQDAVGRRRQPPPA